MALNCPVEEKTIGAATPSNSTWVPPAAVARNLPPALYCAPAAVSGPRPEPKMVTISPGDTPDPPWKLAALRIPAREIVGCDGASWTTAVPCAEGAAKDVAVTVTCTGLATAGGGV